jgi:hypothetical protein
LTGTALFTVGNGSATGVRGNAFTVYSDGRCFSNGYFSTGADYAEFFEGPLGIDVGTSVVYDDGLIRPAVAGEEPDGVVRPKGAGVSTVVGNSAEEEWHGRWLRALDGSYLTHDVVLEVPSDPPTEPLIVRSRVLNPDYDPTVPYIPRSDRPEWYLVGLMGRVLLLPDQPTGARWKRLRKHNDLYDEWLVR